MSLKLASLQIQTNMISEINTLKLTEINFYIVTFEILKKFNYCAKIISQDYSKNL